MTLNGHAEPELSMLPGLQVTVDGFCVKFSACEQNSGSLERRDHGVGDSPAAGHPGSSRRLGQAGLNDVAASLVALTEGPDASTR